MSKKLYRVLVDVKWSEEYMIKADSKKEAKLKAIEKFRGKKGNFQAEAEDLGIPFH